jgi:hypothetical protein
MQNREFFCTDCGGVNPIGFSFCAKCGKKFSYTCPDCETEITPESQYCSHCGVELAWNVPAGPAKRNASIPQPAVRPVEIKINGTQKPAAKSPEKQKKGRTNAAPWIILFALIVVAIFLLFNFESLFK